MDEIRGRVAVVDDTLADLAVLNNLLTENGYEVFAFPGSDRLLAVIDEIPAELFLLDVNLPGINGYELCGRIRRHPVCGQVPVIFISALNEPADKVKGFAAGGVDYVAKPFHLDEVLARVATHIELYRAQCQLHHYSRSLEDLVEARTREAVLAREEGNRIKREVLANVSHEMRTPLNAIIGVLHYLRGICRDGEADEFFAEGLAAADRLMSLVNNVIKYAQSAQSDDTAVLDWQSLANEAVSAVVGKAREKGLLVSVAVDSGLPAGVTGPYTDIIWALELLLDNAIKFSEQGDITLAVEHDSVNRRAVFRVYDSGPGIPEHYRGRLFSLFEQGDGSWSRAKGGVGLGLALCRKIVSSWKGEIRLESTGPSGSVFAFSVPLGRQA
ncbi:MAG: hybrid sensor histidine kinase/response regulator [Negativicutes bacterium]|nr:hybrid sensor histidine kinase/response regulator [Negativicutes bacterium]